METGASVIRGVRDLGPAFDDRYTPKAVLLRALARYQDQLFGKLVDLRLDALRQTQSITISTYNFASDSGTTLTAALHYQGGSVIFSDSSRRREPLDLVPYHHRRHFDVYRWPAYIFGGNAAVPGPRIQLLGTAANWSGVDRIEVDYFPKVQTPPSGMNSAFELPDDHLDVLVAYGALVCARRAKRLGLEVDTKDYEQELVVAEELYISRITGRNRARVGTASEMW